MLTMKLTRSIILTLLSICSLDSSIMHGSAVTQITPKTQKNKSTSLAERIKVVKLMHDHIEEIVTNEFCKPVEFSWLPGYYIKRNITRIAGAKVFRDCIEQHKLKLITVPEKWLYKIPEQYRSKQPDDLVIAKKFNHIPPHEVTIRINLAQAKELCILLNNAHYNGKYYHDTHRGNVLYGSDGRLALIDTEIKDFCDEAPPTCGMNILMQRHAFDHDAYLFMLKEYDKAQEQLKKYYKKGYSIISYNDEVI